jgi:hypothetical protein
MFDLAQKARFTATSGEAVWPPNRVDAHVMEQTLDRYLRDHLAELAEIKIDPNAS